LRGSESSSFRLLNRCIVAIRDRSSVNRVELGSVLGAEEVMTVKRRDAPPNNLAKEVRMGWMNCLH
jgi:hypothetical protein